MLVEVGGGEEEKGSKKGGGEERRRGGSGIRAETRDLHVYSLVKH